MDSKHVPRLTRMIAKFSPESRIAEFRNDWREVTSVLSEGERSALTAVRELVERAALTRNEAATNAVHEWISLYRSLKSVLPKQVIIACLAKIPASPESKEQWRLFLASCTDIDVVRTAV